ncbi:HxlR family transcriptional regulator [Spongiactinospora rosea]|uniref:HxlR family transcriptional regulator n=1 Tax=Spongiactinospora rosea TaxID=2248750 RepID=A0A366M4Q3_9ACTN|nr:winged helix-turn-helix transcriptional regulator [Spongiactinospora rosea]RBQ21161.1 HxlR family transcriptional regulator [Spongiactinospora rosea]
MRTREYGQFCGLARAAELLGQRWTMLILRDLLVGPRRYSDLAAGLPGIPTNVLAARLKELEQDGLVVRQARGGGDRAIVYQVTGRAEELVPALDALASWGAAGMRVPREGEVVTEAALVTALRVAAAGGRPPGVRRAVTYVVRAGEAVAHAIVSGTRVTAGPGEHPAPDLTIVARSGPGFREMLAGTLGADEAVAEGVIEVSGDKALLAEFAATFRVPYSPSLTGPAA